MPEPVIAPADVSTLPIQSATLTFREQREATEKGLTEIPAAPITAVEAVAPVEAEAEADSTKPDAELSEAGRKLRGNRLDARKLKLQGEITELNELLRQRKELREHIAAVPQAPAAAEPRPAALAIDPRDPEPTFESFSTANPTHPDPYAGYLRAQTAWDRRQENRAAAQSHQQQQAQYAQREALSTYETRASELRAKHSDFDAVTQPFIDQYAQHPYSSAVASFLAQDALGPQVLYHLAKHRDAVAELFAPNSNPLVTLGEIKATVKAALKPKTTSITSAPPPPSHTAGAGATATSDAEAKSTSEHFRKRAAEDAERRGRGLR